MLSLRVVHNFVNKFLKCSARLCVSGIFVTPARRTGCAAAEAGGALWARPWSSGSPVPRGFGFRRWRRGRVSRGPSTRFGMRRARPRSDSARPGSFAERPRQRGRHHPDSFQIRPSPADPRLPRARRDVSLNILIFLGLNSTLHPGAAAFPAGIGTLWVCGRG